MHVYYAYPQLWATKRKPLKSDDNNNENKTIYKVQ